MKYPALFVFILSATIPCFAQSLFPSKITHDRLRFKIVTINRQLSLEWQDTVQVFNTKMAELPVFTSITLVEDDLVLTYKPGKIRSDLSYQINIAVETPDSNVLEPRWGELMESPPATGDKGTRRMVWLGFADQLPGFDTEYTLHIRRYLMGAIDCERRPEFTLQKQLPHLGAGVVGVALVGLGQVYNQQKKDAYAQYQKLWVAGNPSEDAENPFFQTAKDKRKAARISSYAGWALLGADALWFTFRWIKIRKQQSIYDHFCGGPATSSIEWHPVLFPDNPYPGIGISFTFSNSRL